MILKKEIIERLKGNSEVRKAIGILLVKSSQTINKYIRLNNSNSPLVSYPVLTLISSSLNVPVDDLIVRSQNFPENFFPYIS